jgi:hypothetical protein
VQILAVRKTDQQTVIALICTLYPQSGRPFLLKVVVIPLKRLNFLGKGIVSRADKVAIKRFSAKVGGQKVNFSVRTAQRAATAVYGVGQLIVGIDDLCLGNVDFVFQHVNIPLIIAIKHEKRRMRSNFVIPLYIAECQANKGGLDIQYKKWTDYANDTKTPIRTLPPRFAKKRGFSAIEQHNTERKQHFLLPCSKSSLIISVIDYTCLFLARMGKARSDEFNYQFRR